MPGITVRVGNRNDLARVARRLRAAGSGGFRRELTSQLTREGRPVLGLVQAAVRGASFPGTGSSDAFPEGGSTNLRGRLAGATTVEPQGTGVRFEVHGARVGPHGHRLAKLTDVTLAPRWRHPVFGNRRAWTTQQGQPWFFVTIRASEPRFRAAILRAMEITVRKIMG